MARRQYRRPHLARWLSETGTTQEELAAKLGVTQTTVSSWLYGSEPSWSLGERLREVTGLTAHELLTTEPDRNEPDLCPTCGAPLASTEAAE